jgi:uncharacterized protein YlxW (UPF0749 family)
MSARSSSPAPPRPARSRGRSRGRSAGGAAAVWLIALLIAVVATVQLRSQAEVERSLQSADPATLAFSIDELHRSNDQLQAQIATLQQQRAALQSGGGDAVDQQLADEATQLRMIEGLVPVHGPGIVFTLDASGLTSLDMQDALNNFFAGGAEAISVNGHRIVLGVDVEQSDAGVTIDGSVVAGPWTFEVIGDSARLAETADAMAQQLKGDRRVREAAYAVEQDLVVRAVLTERPFVYALSS